ncbi:MAG: HNH endonuclease [Rhodocyclaceae bacterium]|nr:HNH endonuclease [Rhodocyclaceae bacterium]
MKITTVGDELFWSYANLGMYHAAISEGADRIESRHYLIRSRLWRQISKDGAPRSLADDERLKLVLPQACSYCGERDRASFTVDHLIPRHRGGADRGENLVWACRSCNSSKRDRDVLEWLASQGQFPSILLLRRYLKLAIEIARERSLLERPIGDVKEELPFALDRVPLPGDFPPPGELRLWVIELPE